MAEPHGGGGTGLLAFIAVLFAGFLFAGVAFALFLSSPRNTPTPPLTADGSPTSSLPIFVQPTASPSPPPTPSPLPSFFLTFTPGFTLPIDTALITPFPSATVPLITPIPTPTIPTTPRPTPVGTPTPPPLSCVGADESNIKTVVLGSGGNPSSVGPTSKAWCIRTVIITPYAAPGGPGNEAGRTQVKLNGRRIAQATCAADACEVITRSFAVPRLAQSGSTLTWEFTCIDNPGTPLPNDECTDGFDGGSTVEIQYSPLPGT